MAEQSYELMHKDDVVASLQLDDLSGAILKVTPGTNPELLPLGGSQGADSLRKWWLRRAVPISQGNIAALLQQEGIPSTQSLLVQNLGLSLSDHYWIRPNGSELTWKDVSLFSNSFRDPLESMQIQHSHSAASASTQTPAYSPSASLQGDLIKKWLIVDDTRCLLKGNRGANSQQSLNEVLASMLHEKQGFANHVHYLPVKLTGSASEQYGCICEDFASETLEFIPAIDVVDSVKKDIRKSNDTLFYLIGTIPVVWLALLLAQSLGGGLPELLRNLTSALEQPTNIIWTDKSLPTILICLAAYGMAVLLYRTNQGRTRDGEEHGSAAWATPASVNAQFAQKESIPLTQHVRLGLDTHKHRRSLNVLVIGGSGAAKTRSFVLPNILTANTNYVITDPKSEVLLATGGYLKEQGYDVRVLNLVNLEQSDGYNPFCYLRDEKDVLKLVNNLIQSTTPKGSHESDPFWTKAETALLQAIILMLFQEAPEYEQNFSMVMRVLEYAEVREEDEGHVSPLDLLFESIERRKPDSVAVRQYKVFKLAAGKTAKSILVSTAVRLAPFNLPQIQALTDHDDMDLYTLGEKKVALYAVIPDNDNTFVRPDRAPCNAEKWYCPA